jgi:CRISPR-associated protein Csb1
MEMEMSISLNDVAKAARESVALRCVAEIQPTAGPGSRVAPPTYPSEEERKPQYCAFKRKLVVNGKVETVNCVVLDSNQSAANRCESALQALLDEGAIELPLMTMTITVDGRDFPVTTLTAPHRGYDSHFFQGLLDGVDFKKSTVGKALTLSNPSNATALLQYAPTMLLFGAWNSNSTKGGGVFGTKIPRVVDSEIVAYDTETEFKGAARIDPLVNDINKKGLKVYQIKEELGGLVTLDKNEAFLKGKNPKEIKPSDQNLGNALAYGINGITMAYAKQTTVISLRRIREYKFPDHKEHTSVAHTYLAVLALASVVLMQETGGYTLRSGCDLQPTAPLTWEIVGKPGEEPVKFTLTADDARRLIREATEVLKKTDMPFETRPVVLEPSKRHIQLVEASLKAPASEDE